MNETEIIHLICDSYENECEIKKGYVIPIDLFAPSWRSCDESKSIFSLICTIFACGMILICYFMGNHWLSKKENKILISEQDKRCSAILVAFIVAFELIYVDGQKIMGLTIPTIGVDIWILNNGLVILTLIYAQLFKEYFKMATYVPYIMYQSTLMCVLVIRMESDNFFSNYDILMVLFFVGYSVFHSYSVPKCFLMTKEHVRFIADNMPQTNTRKIMSFDDGYEGSEDTEMQVLKS